MSLHVDLATNAGTTIDVLGSAAFTPVKNDLLGNIKVRRPLVQPPIPYIIEN